MRLFRRSKSISESQPVLPGSLPEQTVSRSRIDWRRAAPRLIILAVILVGVVSGILWAAGVIGKDKPDAHGKTTIIAQSDKTAPSRKAEPRKVESGKSNGGKPAHSAVATQAEGTSKPAQTASTTPSPSNTSSPTTSSTPGTPATSTTAPSQGGQLTNTGPGETAAIFVATTLIGSIAYQINLRRRLS